MYKSKLKTEFPKVCYKVYKVDVRCADLIAHWWNDGVWFSAN